MLRSLTGLYERRWLAVYFVRRQLFRRYRTFFLGFAWLVLTPLLMVALYTLVFSEILGLRFRAVEGDSSLNFGLYLYCGLIPFLAFAESVTQSVGSIRGNAVFVQKIVFPLEILPISTTTTGLVTKVAGLGVLIAVVAAVEQRLYWTVLLLPLLVVLQLIFMLGMSYLVAVLGTYLPDLKEVLTAVVRAMFFVTPIVWPPEMVPDRLRFVIDYNPLAYLVMAYRDLILEGRLPGAMATLWFGLFSCALLAVGFFVFVKLKPHFADQL